jgi:hypothetical protein
METEGRMNALEPMTVWIGDWPIIHGERGYDLDAENPEACLCGFDYYLYCPEHLTGGIAGLTIEQTSNGIRVSRDGHDHV